MPWNSYELPFSKKGARRYGKIYEYSLFVFVCQSVNPGILDPLSPTFDINKIGVKYEQRETVPGPGYRGVTVLDSTNPPGN